MRFTTLAVAACALVCGSAAGNAATIVQQDSEQGALAGFQGFNPSLGRLDSVTLDISVRKHRYWQVQAPSGTTGPVPVNWTINGNWALNSPALPGGLALPITGTGITNVAFQGSMDDGRQYGYFYITAAGATTLDLAPVDFINQYRLFNGFDTGRTDPLGADTVLTSLAGVTFMHIPNGCQGGGTGEDFCGEASYRLTYTYTPAAELAVPEPTTWLMLTLGFGLLGGGLRRGRIAYAT